MQDDININSWLSVSASGRLDFHSEYGTFASPRISALLRGAGFTSRVSASQGFFASTPLTEETEAAGLSRLQIPRPLKPERGRTVSFDLTRTVGPGSYTVTLFASRIRNPLHVERDIQYELTNLRERATNVGVELVGIVRHESFSATGTYTFVRSRETTDDGQKMENPLTPRHSVGIVGMWGKREWPSRRGKLLHGTTKAGSESLPLAFAAVRHLWDTCRTAVRTCSPLSERRKSNRRSSNEMGSTSSARSGAGWTMDGRCLGSPGGSRVQWGCAA